MEKEWKEILAELQEAEARWAKLLEEGQTAEKPEVLKKGPKPKRIATKIEELARHQIFPLPNTTKSRGGKLNKLKTDLRRLEHQLTYATAEDEIAALQTQIITAKTTIKHLKKNKSKNKQKCFNK